MFRSIPCHCTHAAAHPCLVLPCLGWVGLGWVGKRRVADPTRFSSCCCATKKSPPYTMMIIIMMDQSYISQLTCASVIADQKEKLYILAEMFEI